MSDLMRPIPYSQLLDWVLEEYRKKGSIFGISKIVKRGGGLFPIFEGGIETVFGPAAGPNTQLSQNLIAAYAAGSSWFELKTVQDMDGRDLAACVPKPCILAADEGYNCEWSTELEVRQAFEEYVKAWFVIHVIAREFGLGRQDGIVFNLSVGYNLEKIKGEKVDRFIDGMKDASGTPVFEECRKVTLEAVKQGKLKRVTEKDVEAIPACISSSVTESTLHGCPPAEIESIATYLLTEKHLNTYVKCNPTLLGYEFARKCLDSLGFSYIAFDDHHFLEDLQWKDAVPMFSRLMDLAKAEGLSFGVKLTNTFPVDVKAGELPSGEMYMSGRALFPLTIELVSRITEQFDGKLRISYSGGADYFNIHELVSAGVWPVTMATTLLKPGGYQRLEQIAELLDDIPSGPFVGVDLKRVRALAKGVQSDPHYRKPAKPLPSRKMEEALPLMDCFKAPCQTGCPIHQDIPAYLRAMKEGRAEDALRIILERNPLPFITGTICPHTCADRCMRNYYEEGLHIRDVKLQAALKAAGKVLREEKDGGAAGGRTDGQKKAAAGTRVAVIGGGPGGLSAASFLSRAGIDVTVFDKGESLGGVVRKAIPEFRIANERIDRDIELCSRFGAKFVTGREIRSIRELRQEGFTDIIVAVGAWRSGHKVLQYGDEMDALDFLTRIRKAQNSVRLGEDVIVVGGGNTAMDVARAALRQKGVKHVRLVYRRTQRYMPADEEELQMAIEDGVEFMELLAPVGVKDGQLECTVMELKEADESGRRRPVETDQKVFLPCSAVIAAVGERVDGSLFAAEGVKLDERGLPLVDGNLETSVDRVYAIGDCRRGPATVVKAIADAQAAAEAIAGISFDRFADENEKDNPAQLRSAKGVLTRDLQEKPDGRCLGCAAVCEVCTDVCPNRANIAVTVPGLVKTQILHVDGMCNECGNCAVFCPYSGRPYKDKLTLFWYEEDFRESENEGFLFKEGTTVTLRFAGKTADYDVADKDCGLYDPLRKFILAVITDYAYLLK